MKKLFKYFLLLLLTLNTQIVYAQDTELKMVTVTTSFLYDMVQNLAEGMVDLHIIIPPGEDPHVYVAQPQDLIKLEAADLVLYHGLHFEGRMNEALEEMGYAVTETFTQEQIGMMEDDEATVTVDPHFWFDIDLYKEAVMNVSHQLVELVPEHQQAIEDNTETYLQELDELKEYAQQQIESIPEEKRYLVTPHDAFNYFSREFNIPVIAPQGLSTDSEVANSDIDRTVKFIVEHQIEAIFAESTTDPIRMEKLREASRAQGHDVRVVSGEGNELFSDSLAPQGQVGDTYITMFRHNVDLIVENLK